MNILICICCELSGESQFGENETDFCELCDHDELIVPNYKGIVPEQFHHLKKEEWLDILKPLINKNMRL